MQRSEESNPSIVNNTTLDSREDMALILTEMHNSGGANAGLTSDDFEVSNDNAEPNTDNNNVEEANSNNANRRKGERPKNSNVRKNKCMEVAANDFLNKITVKHAEEKSTCNGKILRKGIFEENIK